MGQLVSVRSNTNFSVNYEQGTLIPETEIIIIIQSPVYKLNETGDKIEKTNGISELRFTCNKKALHHLIEHLQQLEERTENSDQVVDTINEVIANSKPKEQ